MPLHRNSRYVVAVPNLLSIVTVAYEMLTAVFTTVRTVQALNIGGLWWVQQKSPTLLVLREGETNPPIRSALGLLYFVARAGQGTLLTLSTQVHHFIHDTLPNFPISKPFAPPSAIDPLT